jgi:protein-S-isoprenylcysteine O-methyltransferase Ste14
MGMAVFMEMMNEYFNWFQWMILASWAFVGIGRGMLMKRRGVNVLAPDPERSSFEIGCDALMGMGMFLEFWEVIAYTVPVPFHFGLGFLSPVILDVLWLKWAGLLVLAVSLVFYARSVLDLGMSWRFGIDRESSGGLVTKGVYGICRHPIYLSLDLFFLGTFLVQGRLVFAILPLALIPILHLQMLREERFLGQNYGEAYGQYCSRVRRYVIF